MEPVVLTIHTLLVLALVGVVLLQRSEGGALGIGGGGGGGMMSGRGAANVLTRTTTVLAALFFTTSLGLALISDRGLTEEEIRRQLTGEPIEAVPTDAGDIDASDILGLDPVTVPDAPVTVPEEGAAEEETPE